MGARPEDYARSAPYKSYIHVDDFESPKELAEYLTKLDQDDSLYNEYFKWKVKLIKVHIWNLDAQNPERDENQMLFYLKAAWKVSENWTQNFFKQLITSLDRFCYYPVFGRLVL